MCNKIVLIWLTFTWEAVGCYNFIHLIFQLRKNSSASSCSDWVVSGAGLWGRSVHFQSSMLQSMNWLDSDPPGLVLRTAPGVGKRWWVFSLDLNLHCPSEGENRRPSFTPPLERIRWWENRTGKVDTDVWQNSGEKAEASLSWD